MAGSKRSHDTANGDGPAIVRKKPSASPTWANTKTVTIVVNDTTEFQVHSEHLMAKVPHFKKHFGPDSKFKEGKDDRCFIPIEHEVFHLIMGWIYQDMLPAIPTQLKILANPPTKGRSPAAKIQNKLPTSGSAVVEETYHKIIIEAEAWLCKPLAGAALDAIRTFHHDTGDRLGLDLVYKGIKFAHHKTDYVRFLKLYIFTDVIDNGTVAFGEHMKAASELEGAKTAFMENMFWFACEQSRRLPKDRPTLPMLMDLKVPFYRFYDEDGTGTPAMEFD